MSKLHPAIKSVSSDNHNTVLIADVVAKSNSPIDHLGHVLAQINDLEQQAKPLKEEVKAMGPGQHDGQLFRATVSDVDESESYDAAAMEAKLRELGVKDQWFRHHKKIKAGYRKVLVKGRS